MAGVSRRAQPRTKTNPVPRYRCWYVDRLGTRKFLVLTAARDEVLRNVCLLEAREKEVRLGLREDFPAIRHRGRAIQSLLAEYFRWGESHGGRHGMPWSAVHRTLVRARLSWWVRTLDLQTMGDLAGSILPRVESALQGLQGEGMAGQTLQHYAGALKGFVHWGMKMKYLSVDPLADLGTFDRSPTMRRRALSIGEIRLLLDIEGLPEWRRLLYETALLSGLRAGELRSLQVSDLLHGELHLHAEWTKARVEGTQPIPRELEERLRAFSQTGMARKLSKGMSSVPEEPLLHVPLRCAEILRKDLEKAGIPENTPAGRLDFHALRTTYTSLIVEGGASAREAMSLARHATVNLTMGTYARARNDRLTELTQAVGDKVLKPQNSAPSVHGTQPISA